MVQTPKAKAAYLVVKYMSKVVHMRLAIECALVAVDEIIEELIVTDYANRFNYWQEVKKEIELL